jgi:pimeloyl-ACP methyl ester carboxylesterase
MLQNSPASLASALDAGRNLSARFVFGAEQSVAWSELLFGPCLDRRTSELRGRSILIETMDQLTAISALIELDGVTMKIQRDPSSSLGERAGYFPVSGAHLYTVLHEVPNPVARVLLVGSFASERHTSYLPWVRWARYLAEQQIEVLRYDYRGVGESTGSFKDATCEAWMNDVQQLATWFKNRGDDQVPLILHGLEMGGILAARVFHNGEADALILWSAPVNANKVLRSTLQRWIGPQQLLKSEDERRPVSHFFRLLEEGESVEVEGYEWTPALWRESIGFDLPAAMIPPQDPTKFYRRPVRIVELGKTAAPLVKGGLLQGFEEAKDFTWLFAPNYHWIASTLKLPVEAS